MKPRTKTALGIDIGKHRISAALVEKSARGFKVIAAANGDLPAGDSGQHGAQTKVISRVFRKIGRRARMHGARTAVAASPNSTIMRLLDLPRQMPANIGEFVDAELSQCVALSGRRKQADFCGIGTGSGVQKRLLAVAADAEELEEILGVCRAAGIAADSVEPAALSYARAFLTSQNDIRYGGSTLVAILGANNLVVCLFCKGVLDFVRIRNVPAGADSPERLCAWLTEELNTVSQYHHGAVSNTSRDVQTRLILHDGQYDKSSIARLLGPGTGSLVVMEACEAAALPAGGAEGISPLPSAMAVGAALRQLDMEGDELRIDLTPHEVIHARASSKHLLIAANAVAATILAVFLIGQFLTQTTDAMNRRIGQARLTGELYTVPAKVAQDHYVDGEIARIHKELAGMDAVLTRWEVNWPAVLNAVGQSTPAGVCVTHLACSDSEHVSLKGLAVSYEQAKTLAQHLDGQSLFESVRLARMERRQAATGVFEYEIECVLRTIKKESLRDRQSQS